MSIAVESEDKLIIYYSLLKTFIPIFKVSDCKSSFFSHHYSNTKISIK